MYLPAHFAESDPASLHALMAAQPLATLVTYTARGLVADHIPLLFDSRLGPQGTLLGHVARANPLWRDAADGDVLAVFQGPQAYISPNWYPGKQEHGKAVPTWNYVAVHARGKLRVRDDAEWLRALLRRLTAVHEAAQPQPWTLDEAPADYMASMLRAIVGFEIEIADLQGKWKTSQNQSASNQRGVVAGLAQTGTAEVLAMAKLVEQHLGD